MRKQQVMFVLSIDTEEEFDWDGTFPRYDCSVENIAYVPQFQTFCESLRIRPTYLVDYPVAADENSAAVIKAIVETGNAEVGAHLHPWCTPPIIGPNTERESHVVNLPTELVRQKLQALTDAIRQNIGVTPTVFRTGRWGINSAVLRIVADVGFSIDSSIYPYYANEYFSCLKSCDQPYWPSWDNPDIPGGQRTIFELPVTAGFNRPNFPLWGKIHQLLASKLLKPFRPVAMAWHSNVLKKLYLSPELSSAEEMIALIKAALATASPVLHMFLHSSSLLPGNCSYAAGRGGGDLYDRIRSVIEFLATEMDVGFCTVSEAVKNLNKVTKGTESRVDK